MSYKVGDKVQYAGAGTGAAEPPVGAFGLVCDVDKEGLPEVFWETSEALGLSCGHNEWVPVESRPETKIELIRWPTADDWMLAYEAALITIGKVPTREPSDAWKRKILRARHSPIRELKFVFRLTNVPYWVAGHLVRHIHAQPYVGSQRNDRQNKYDRNAARQDAPVNMLWSMGAEELITIANKRLCMKAAAETREVVEQMCVETLTKCPEFADELVPMCVRNGGVCYEFASCGRCGT